MRVYHFLSPHDALNDLALRRIRISRYGDLNDPFELLAASMGDKQLRRAMTAWKDEFHRTKGVLCFSKNWSNPVLWSHYALKHRGVALGFDLKDEFGLEVDYSEERIPIRFQDNDPALGVDLDFVAKIIRTKFIHWKYEEEIRLHLQLDEGTLEDGSYFYSFCNDLALREVVLGSLCALPIDAVRSLVDSIYRTVVIRKARLAFRSFEVIPDQRYENHAV